MAAVRFLISGRVQRVSFRAYTQAQANTLGLRGYARNLSDGRVEVLAVGEAEAIERLAEWLRHGPPLARVDAVQREAAEDSEASEGFDIG